MRGTLGVAGGSVAAALCCLAIPLTVGIIGVSDLVALGVNLGVAVVAATGIAVLWFAWKRAGDGGEGGRS